MTRRAACSPEDRACLSGAPGSAPHSRPPQPPLGVDSGSAKKAGQREPLSWVFRVRAAGHFGAECGQGQARVRLPAPGQLEQPRPRVPSYRQAWKHPLSRSYFPPKVGLVCARSLGCWDGSRQTLPSVGTGGPKGLPLPRGCQGPRGSTSQPFPSPRSLLHWSTGRGWPGEALGPGLTWGGGWESLRG